MTKTFCLKAMLVAIVLAVSPLTMAAQDEPDVSEQVAPLDINAADATAIAEALEGIGLVKAREIVAYREMFGKFRSVDELLEVKGIGAATVEKNRHRILIAEE